MTIENRGPNKWRFTLSKDGAIFRKNFIGTEAQAKKEHEAFKVDVQRGQVGLNESMKFGELAQLVMDEYVKTQLKYNTRRIYTNNYNSHILPKFGNMRLKDIKSLHIQRLSNELSKKYKPSTVENALTVLNVTLKFGVKWGFIKESPYQFIEKPRVKKSNHDELLSMEEIQKLLSIYEQETNTLHKAAFYLAIGCGLRNSEIRALTTDDIDFKTNIIRVNKQQGEYIDEEGNLQRGDIATKTDGSKRKVYAPQFVMDALREHMKGIPYTSITKQVFFNANTGNAISRHCLSKRFTTLLKNNALPAIRFHDLRHLHATLLISTGTNIKTVSKRLGHSDVQTTLSTYTHTIEEVDKEVANTLDKALSDLKGNTKTKLF